MRRSWLHGQAQFPRRSLEKTACQREPWRRQWSAMKARSFLGRACAFTRFRHHQGWQKRLSALCYDLFHDAPPITPDQVCRSFSARQNVPCLRVQFPHRSMQDLICRQPVWGTVCSGPNPWMSITFTSRILLSGSSDQNRPNHDRFPTFWIAGDRCPGVASTAQ